MYKFLKEVDLMSYSIIRNEKYTKDKINQLCPHNERFKKKYSNQNIDLSKTSQNYHLKRPIENTYVKEFNRLVENNKLYISRKRPDMIYGCEMIITSDKDFFDKIGQEETKRYFKESYKFVSKYQNLGSYFSCSTFGRRNSTHALSIYSCCRWSYKKWRKMSKSFCKGFLERQR